MVGSSKILTVSYGTFSCTLEGFDDSFNTMKAIAEYFRGLASDDRYFGAEPPTPDAEMLAKIAEREISRRVEASMDESGIVLRAAALTDQSDVPSDMAETAPDSGEPLHDKESRAEVEAARKAEKAERKAKRLKAKAERKAARDAEEAEQAAAEAKAEAEAEAKAKTDDAAKAAQDIKSDEEDAVDKSASTSESDILSSVSAATAEQAEGTSGSDVEETRDNAPSSMLAADDPAPATSDVPAHPDADSVAAKLQRIRAVVGNAGDGEDSTADNSSADDLTAQFLPQTETPDVADLDANDDVIGDPVAELDAHEAEMEQEAPASDPVLSEPDADNASDDGSDMISRVMAGHADADADAGDTADMTPDVAATPQPQARVIRMKRTDFDKAVENGEINAPKDGPKDAPKVDAGPDLGLLDGADDLDDYLEDSDFTDTNMSGVDTADLAEDLAAIEADFAPQGSADLEQDDDAAETDTSTLDAVSSAVAADTSVEGVAEDIIEDVASDEGPKSALLSEDPQVDDAALDRLMSESDAQMKEPEGSRRRDAIAQLKAAVAAKEAARQVGEPEDDGQDAENAFRNDLSEAVRPDGAAVARPRPVVRTSNRTERPRPAPLKLVAAQRVDLDEVEARDGPVVPRRVAARQPDAQLQSQAQAAGSFAEFADNMGASELPDLLEAAAAYTSFVEGADEFSRPQILRRVRAVASDDFNREDGLRSFADLLRAGRFTKVRNGRFQVADDSRFNPERRAS